MTLANRVTMGRFFLLIVYFILLGCVVAGCCPEERSLLLTICFVLFLIVAFTDLLDGYLARKYKEVTALGRIADPFVDKIAVCGSFVFFLSMPPLNCIFYAWFVVVILAREFLVTGIRAAAEAGGIPFGAKSWGKHKTLVQNTAIGTALGYVAFFDEGRWPETLTVIMMWLTLGITVVSGVVYVHEARKVFGTEKKVGADGENPSQGEE